MQWALDIGSVLAEKAAQDEIGRCHCLGESTWQLLHLAYVSSPHLHKWAQTMLLPPCRDSNFSTAGSFHLNRSLLAQNLDINYYLDYACVWCLAPRQAPMSLHKLQVSGVACLVGVQRTVQNNRNTKSEPKDLACEESPIRAFYFWTLVLLPLSWRLRWTDFFVLFFCRVGSHHPHSAFIYALDSAKYVHCKGPATLSSPSSITNNARIKRHLSSWAQASAQIDIPSMTSNWDS